MTSLPLWFAEIESEGEPHAPTNERGESSGRSRQSAPRTTRRAAFELPGDLVSRLRMHDPSAINVLFDVAFVPLTRFAYGFVRAMDVAEDVVQNVFVRIWTQGSAWTPHTSVVAYLYRAVRHEALNVVRHDAVNVRLRQRLTDSSATQGAWGGLPAAFPTPDEAATRREIASAFHAALDMLTERQRTAVLLRYEQGQTVSDVADILGIVPRAAEKLLSRAVAQLRVALEHVIR